MTVLHLLQLFFILAASPLCFGLGVYMVLSRPMLTEHHSSMPSLFWKALTVLVFSFSLVALRDWFIIQSDGYGFSYPGFAIRTFMFGAVISTCWAAWKSDT